MRVPESKISLPIPNLDDKTFDELFEEARSLIPRYAPDWTNHNFSDPGITLIDLFAWLTEMEIYTLNRINDRNILKFLKLLGEAPKAPKPARVNLEFSIDGYRTQPVEIKKGIQAITVDSSSNEQLIFETDSDLIVSNVKIAHIFSKHLDSNNLVRFVEQTNNNISNSSFYFAFGNKALHKSEFYIAFSAGEEFPEDEISLLINTYEADLPDLETGEDPILSAKLEWQFKGEPDEWQLLEVKEDTTVALTRSGRILFQGNNQFKKAGIQDITGVLNTTKQSFYWIRAVVKEAGYEIPPRIDFIFVNAVTATQTKTINKEYISIPKNKSGLPYLTLSLPYLTLSLQNKPVLENTLVLKIFEEDRTWYQWQRVSDFDASQPMDRHYIIDLQSGEIQFGDGINGRIPPEVELPDVNSNILAEQYKVGGGTNGNVKPDHIKSLLTPDVKAKVNNPRAATGGISFETLDAAQHRVRKDLKQPGRAVQCDDFEKLAKRTPGLRLQRVKVLPLYHPDYPSIKMPGSITVVVVPYILPNTIDRPQPSEGFLQTVANFLRPRCLLATHLHVIAPEFVRVNLEIDLIIEPRKDIKLMSEKIKLALRKFLNPNIDESGNQGWPFGRAVYKSEIYQVLQDFDGIICVKNVSLTSDKPHAEVNGNILIPKIGLVYYGECIPKFSEGNS